MLSAKKLRSDFVAPESGLDHPCGALPGVNRYAVNKVPQTAYRKKTTIFVDASMQISIMMQMHKQLQPECGSHDEEKSDI